MTNLEIRFDAVTSWFHIIDLFVLAILAIAVVELVWDLVTRNKQSLWETAANVLISSGNIVLEKTAYGLIFLVGLLIVESIVFIKLPINIYTWVIAIILADFTYYWMHRLEHEIRFFWAVHSVHHSSTEFDLTTGLRLAWSEGLIEWIFFVPLVLIDFDVVQVIVSISVVVAYQTWIHTEKIRTLGWLDKVFNTPSVHRVHHGANPQYIDKNYGGLLILWDRLFGTYEPEDEKVIYGLTKQIGTSNPVRINFHEVIALYRDCAKARNISECWNHLSKHPGWKPDNQLSV